VRKGNRQRRRTIQIINSEWKIESAFPDLHTSQLDLPSYIGNDETTLGVSVGLQNASLSKSVPNLTRTLGRGRARKKNFNQLPEVFF